MSAPSSWSTGRERGPSWGALNGPLLRHVPPRQGPSLVRARCPCGWLQPLPWVLSHQEAPRPFLAVAQAAAPSGDPLPRSFQCSSTIPRGHTGLCISDWPDLSIQEARPPSQPHGSCQRGRSWDSLCDTSWVGVISFGRPYVEEWGSRQTRPVFTGSFHQWVLVPAWTAIQDCGSHSNTTGHCPQHPPCWPGYTLHSWPQFTHIHGGLGGEGGSVPAPHSTGWLGEGQSLPQATWPGQMPGLEPTSA